jgi:hypothetical protein
MPPRLERPVLIVCCGQLRASQKGLPANDGTLQILRRQLHKRQSQHAAKACTTRPHRFNWPRRLPANDRTLQSLRRQQLHKLQSQHAAKACKTRPSSNHSMPPRLYDPSSSFVEASYRPCKKGCRPMTEHCKVCGGNNCTSSNHSMPPRSVRPVLIV